MTNKTVLTLGETGHNGKAVMAFASATVKAYTKLAIQLHQAACLTFYQAAQYGNCDALNVFYAGLRVNDQTALRVWFGSHTSYVNLANQEVKNWIKFSAKDGFSIVKGVEEYRKDLFTVDEQVEGKTMLLGLEPFYNRNVKEAKAFTLEELLGLLSNAAKNASKKAESEGVVIPSNIATLIKNIDRETSAEIANLKRVVTE